MQEKNLKLTFFNRHIILRNGPQTVILSHVCYIHSLVITTPKFSPKEQVRLAHLRFPLFVNHTLKQLA